MSSAKFDLAWPPLLQHEGSKYTNDPIDPGGHTKFGLTLGFLRGLPASVPAPRTVEDLKAVTESQAKEIYFSQWWKYEDFAANVGSKLLDMAVNMGASQAHKLAQRASTALGKSLEDDGILGPTSRTVLTHLDPDQFLKALRDQCVKFYNNLIARKPQFEKYRKGWMKRALS